MTKQEYIAKLAKVISEARDNAPFYVMPRFKNKYDVVEMLPPGLVDYVHYNLLPQDQAEEECARLNDEYVAKQVLKFVGTIIGGLFNEQSPSE